MPAPLQVVEERLRIEARVSDRAAWLRAQVSAGAVAMRADGHVAGLTPYGRALARCDRFAPRSGSLRWWQEIGRRRWLADRV